MKNLKTFVALKRKRESHILKNKERLKSHHSKLTTEKGITLIALVVNIVVLLILAGITITALFGDNGLITRVVIADQKTQEGAQKDIEAIEDLGTQLNTILNGTGDNPPGITPTSTIEELMAKASTDNEIVLDKYGNPIKVPAGFKILAHGTQSRY